MAQRLAGVQALRGVACLMVVLFHVADLEMRFGLRVSPLRWVNRFGFAGVDLFFVLSGFVIAVSARRGAGEVPGFLARRVWRIYPPFWAAFLLAIGHHLWSDVPVGGGLVEQAFLLPSGENPPRLVPVAWTLSYELMFYLAFGLLLAVPGRWAAVALFGWATVVVGCSLAGPPPADRFARLAVSPHVLEFLAGALVASLPGRLSVLGTGGAILAAVGWVVAGLWLTFDPEPTRLAASPLQRVYVFGPAAMLLVWTAVAHERAGGRTPPRWALALGDASYSIYLVHLIPLLVVTYAWEQLGWGHSRSRHLLWIGVCVVAAVVVGVLFYRVIERPVLAWGKRRRWSVRIRWPWRIPSRRSLR